MTDSEKPFACPSPGCNMSFTNEDHLTVHKKKHDMVLNLGANGKGNVFVADQTPTPTRFIRNCEEVGLFQDLQNVNPFEETFRRAVEACKMGSIAVSEIEISDDTLHTPHIFPHIADVQTTTQTDDQEALTAGETNATDNHVKNTAITMCSSTVSKRVSTNERKNVKIIAKTKETKNTSETIIVQEGDTSNSASSVAESPLPQLSINGEKVQLLLKTSDGKLMQLSAVQLSENQDNSENTVVQQKKQMVVIKTEPLLNCTEKNKVENPASPEMSLAKMKLKQALSKNVMLCKNEKELKKDESTTIATRMRMTHPRSNKGRNEDHGKKQEILERNRASSMRARAKRKMWIQQMQSTVDNVNDTNAALQLEIRALRAEVAKLKTLLLAHRDCPVTKAMERGNGIILGPKVISVNSGLVQVIPNATASPLKRTAASPGALIAPKKKIITKNPVILPKSDVNAGASLQNAKIVRNLSTVKIVNVQDILGDKDIGKQIMMMQNRMGKNGGDQRQIVQINSNFDVDNAASKSTGT